jgi:hypothetical protein
VRKLARWLTHHGGSAPAELREEAALELLLRDVSPVHRETVREEMRRLLEEAPGPRLVREPVPDATQLTEPDRREHVAKILERALEARGPDRTRLIRLAITALRASEVRRVAE